MKIFYVTVEFLTLDEGYFISSVKRTKFSDTKKKKKRTDL